MATARREQADHAALAAAVVAYVLGHAAASGLSFALWFMTMSALAVRGAVLRSADTPALD